MALIHVPRPDPESMMNRNRPVNALLKMQMEHLHAAETKLPIGMQTDTYINAIKTEGEAAEYIRSVTEAIHSAHAAAEKKRSRPALKPKRVISIAAVADERPVRNRARTARKKKNNGKRARKK